MARPKIEREVCLNPAVYYFKPRGIPVGMLEEVNLTLDELEAVRLADLLQLYQEEAAGRMNISRTTFSRLIASAHNKIADGLINGKAIKIPQQIPDNIKVNLNVCSSCGKKRKHKQCPHCLKNQGGTNEISSSIR